TPEIYGKHTENGNRDRYGFCHICPWIVLYYLRSLLSGPSLILFFAVHAPVDFLLRVSQDEYMVQLLLDRGDAPGILAPDDIFYLLGKMERLFLDNLLVLDDVDGDVVINEPQDVQVHKVDGTLDLHDILLPHLAALGV